MSTVELSVWQALPCLDLMIARLQRLREILTADENRQLRFELPGWYAPVGPGLPPLPGFCGGPCLPSLLEGNERTSVVLERVAGLLYGVATVIESEPTVSG